MANKTFTGPGFFDDNTKWDGSTTPSAGDNITITTGTCTVRFDEAIENAYGDVTINSGITFDLQSFNFFATNLTNNGKISMVAAGDLGLYLEGNLTLNSGSEMDMDENCYITIGGNFTMPDEILWTTPNTGQLYMTQSGNYAGSTYHENAWYYFTIETLATVTFTANSVVTNGASFGNTAVQAGIDGGTYTVTLGAFTAMVLARGTITGSGTIRFHLGSAVSTLTRPTTAAGHTGTIQFYTADGSDRLVWASNWRNAHVEIVVPVSASPGSPFVKAIFAGHSNGVLNLLSCKNFTVTLVGANSEADINLATNNSSMDISGNVTVPSGTYFSWTKGTGTITLSGTSGTQTINFAGKTIEDIIVNASGATKQFSSGTVTTDSITLTAGTMDNSANNPNFITDGGITAAAVLTYTKGTGFIQLTGSSGTQTIDIDGKSLEDVIISAAGATKSIVKNFSVTSLSGTGGTVQSSVAATQRTITATNKGVCISMTFKDISMGSAARVGAKNSCTNNGNNLGIVFRDKASNVA